ncbi:MAG: HD domain-containing protein [Clostridia bacterium]|nr:HD domain-containing protein [Clostridia bacterium]
MLVLSGICGIMTLFVYLTKTMTKSRKLSLMLLEFSAMLLLISDRRAYIFRGDTSSLGWWMVRISNFLVFFLTLVVLYSFNRYLIDLYTHEGGLDAPPKRLKAASVLMLVGMAMVVVSQFTGFYYTFDEMNRYQRAPGYIVCYLVPMSVLVLQMSVIVQYLKRLRRGIGFSILLFAIFSVIASVLQAFVYGVSLNNMMIVAMAALLYIFALKDMDQELDRVRKLEIEYYKEEKKKEHALFEQTAEALATAIDAKDKYTHGHSTRVAMYSTQIAREAGKTDEECEQVYFAALLHDVGKIGISDAIIGKDFQLTDEEFAQIKQHPVYGSKILSNIQLWPYLSIGAHYHHERYDGKGYPEGLKGEDIPDIARIIAVADSYDAMTSKRSYRDPMPQQNAREEMVKGIGMQFDPEYAKIMLHLIDLDVDYTMREQNTGTDDVFATRLHCETIYHDRSTGIQVTSHMVRIHLYSKADDGFPKDKSLPTLVLFDALDARIHENEAKKNDLLYLEYGQIRVDGRTICKEARKMETSVKTLNAGPGNAADARFVSYDIEAVRVKDHVLIRISDGDKLAETIVALPDSARFSYISLTGEHCQISNIRVDRDEDSVAEDYIPRIAEEISYIRDCPQGDVPNVQIDGWRQASTEGMPITDDMRIVFHTQSLPTARLVWHCPYVSIFTSNNGSVKGEGYREFLLLRLDGENWESDDHADNEVQINHTKGFPGWSVWKDKNKRGMDCEVSIRRDGNRITIHTENVGIVIDSLTTIKDEIGDVYIALTGDQCSLTNIRVMREAESRP